MRRIVLAFSTIPLGATLIVGALAQVRVTLPSAEFRSQEHIRATVENDLGRPITYCVEFGQTSTNGSDIESTPSPFEVQQRTGGRWSTLLIGPDVGSSRHALVLEPGKSQEFNMRLNSRGNLRLQLRFWIGSLSDVICADPPKNRKKIRSKVFTIK